MGAAAGHTGISTRGRLARGAGVKAVLPVPAVLTALAVAAAVVAALCTASVVGAQGARCQFVLGFADLRALVGAPIVGECLEDQRFAANGDALQQTTGGLLAWRKADNWTAFTDGARTWLNGPQGLQQRPNEVRFAWEGDAIAMQGNAFLRPEVTVGAGTTLWWVNVDPDAHDVVALNGSFESPIIGRGASWSHTFSQPGRYAYVCTLHANMGGVVVVTP